MSDYTKVTDFASKDALAPGHASKVVKGTEIDAEFELIETAIASKADTAGETFTGTTTVAAFTATGALTFSGLTASTVPYLSAGKVLTSSAVTPTELGYLSGVTSALQTQLGLLAPKANPTFTGTLTAATGSFSAAVTATQFNVSSSRELKQDIRPVAPGALGRVLDWNISEYAYKQSPERNEIGLVAEDTDHRISSGKSINVNAAIFELAAAVQELARKVAH
jgi:hypothetical protein